MYALCLACTVPANLAAAAFLGHLALGQIIGVLRNRTTLSPGDGKYDVGLARNVRMVFGEQPLLWPIPTTPHITTSDGYTWPLNPNHRIGGGRSRSAVASRDAEAGGTHQARRRPHTRQPR